MATEETVVVSEPGAAGQSGRALHPPAPFDAGDVVGVEAVDVPPARAASPGATRADDAEAVTQAAAGREEGVADAARSMLLRYVTQHLPDEPPVEAAPAEAPPRRTGAHARLLPVLRLVPWGLGALFALSFAWDFPGAAVSLLGRTFVFEGLLRIVAVSGLIGFLTNWLAITMLFQPRRPRPLVGQGLVPAQRERIAYRLAQAVSDELISEAMIKRKIRESGLIRRYRERAMDVARSLLDDPAFRRDLRALAGRYLADTLSAPDVQARIAAFTEEQIEAQARGPLGLALGAYRLFNEDAFQRRIREAIERLPRSLDPVVAELDAVLDRIPDRLDARSDELDDMITQLVLSFVENLDVERIVVENVRGYDEQQLEQLLKRTTNEQLNYIKYLGGVLGLVGGFVIWEPVAALAGLGSLGGLIYAADEALLRLRDRAEADAVASGDHAASGD